MDEIRTVCTIIIWTYTEATDDGIKQLLDRRRQLGKQQGDTAMPTVGHRNKNLGSNLKHIGMLEDLLKGQEKSRLVIITDDAECPGRHLLLNWIHFLGTRCDKIILACYERQPSFFQGWLSQDIQNKLIVLEGKATPKQGGDLTDVLDNVLNVASQIEGNVGVVIDSLSLQVILKTTTLTCSTLHKLAIGNRVCQVVALLHRDVHDQNTCALLEHTASSVIELLSVDRSSYAYCVRHCRPTGKVFKTREYFTVDDNFHIKNFGTSLTDNNPIPNVLQSDPTADLPFSLSLTDSEKDARSKVKLPYLKDGSGDLEMTSGRIFYQPDQSDDFDEEDPDDDLNI